jgi:hypothetical protein
MNLGVCNTENLKPRNEDNGKRYTTSSIKSSWKCVCVLYPDAANEKAVCTTHIEVYAQKYNVKHRFVQITGNRFLRGTFIRRGGENETCWFVLSTR